MSKCGVDREVSLPLSLSTPVSVGRDLEVAKGIGLLTELLSLWTESRGDGHDELVFCFLLRARTRKTVGKKGQDESEGEDQASFIRRGRSDVRVNWSQGAQSSVRVCSDTPFVCSPWDRASTNALRGTVDGEPWVESTGQRGLVYETHPDGRGSAEGAHLLAQDLSTSRGGLAPCIFCNRTRSCSV